MLNRLRERCEDESDRTWSLDVKLNALRDAELLIVNEVSNDLINKELGTETTKVFAGNGGVAVIQLPSDIAMDEILSVVREENILISWKTIDRSETIRYSNPLLAPSYNKPIGFIEAGSFFSLMPSDIGKTAKLFYLRNPKTMVETNPSTGEVSTCELNEALHPIVLLKAEAILWRADDESERANVAEMMSARALDALNKNPHGSDLKEVKHPTEK